MSPLNQYFDLPDGRPESPPIAPLFLTQFSPEYINESSQTFLQTRESHVPKISARGCFALKFVPPEHSQMTLY